MDRILSVDLAYKRIQDFGLCLIEIRHRPPIRVRFLSPDDLGLTDPPRADECAQKIFDYCCAENIRIVMLDGPQGWKDPKSPLKNSRCCERILNAPAKTGTVGRVKPRNYTPFVKFSVRMFAELLNLGAVLLKTPIADLPSSSVLALEILPLSAWRKLCIDPLPGKRKATAADIKERLQQLCRKFDFDFDAPPNHDQLQALVSGLAGLGILNSDPSRYIAEGTPPKEQDGLILEGYIVNPRA